MGPRARARTALAAASIAGLLLACSCGGGGRGDKPATTSATAASATSRCVPAQYHHTAPPAWTASAWSDSSAGSPGPPYALASGDAAAAFLFTPRLRVGHRTDPANKILWIMRYPRAGHPLLISALSVADPRRAVTFSLPPDSSPGEIYPSYIDLPRPGCWRLSLAWGDHRASIDLAIHPS